MPVTFLRNKYNLWLDPGFKNVKDLANLLVPFDATQMRCFRVSTRVNAVSNDDPDCVVQSTSHSQPRGLFSGNPQNRDEVVRFERCFFGSIRIDRVTYNHDVVIDRGMVRERKNKASKKFREAFGHTPLFVEVEAKRRKIEHLLLLTAEAIAYFDESQPGHFVPHAEYPRPNTGQRQADSVQFTFRTWPPDRIRRTIGAGENGRNV